MKKIFKNPCMVIVEINDQEIVTQSLGYGGEDAQYLKEDEEAVANSRSRHSIWDD